MFLTQYPKERNNRETFQRTVLFKQCPSDNVQEKLSKELCSGKEPESQSQIQTARSAARKAEDENLSN
jgi:hypothetical protein